MLATILSPVLVDNGLNGPNEFRYLDPGTNLVPINVSIAAGADFYISLQFVDTGTGVGPSLLNDGVRSGYQELRNFVANPFQGGLPRSDGWFPTYLLVPGGGTGIGIRAIIQPVPEPSTYALAAMGVVAILAISRRKKLA